MNDAPGQERLRLINALVAEKVMGWRVCDRTDVQDGTWWQTQRAPALATYGSQRARTRAALGTDPQMDC